MLARHRKAEADFAESLGRSGGTDPANRPESRDIFAPS